MNAFKATVSGKVQGVYFRDFARLEAQKLQITGWIKNLSDGTVVLEAEGDEEKLKLFASWLYHGSPRSQVDKVQIEEIQHMDAYTSFEIRT